MTTTRSLPTAIGGTDGIVRGLTAAGVLMSADVHLALYFGGFGTVPTIGTLFLVNAVAGLVIGAGILVWRHWLAAFFAFGFNAVTLAAFYLSVAVGLFGFRETAGGTQQVIAEVAEIVGLVGAAILLGLHWQRSRALVRA
jgi:hypothetical protein